MVADRTRPSVASGRTGDKTDGVPDDRDPIFPEIRVSDQDRERAVVQLRQHVADGSLTLDEFADRVGVALSARTRGDLDSVLADLPAAPLPETRRHRARRWVVAFMSGSQAKGRWRVGKSVTAVAVMGGCELDFRQAEIDAEEVRVTAIAVMGGIDIVVPEGIAVELTGFPVMGGKHLKIADVPFLPGSPVISVRAFPFMGGVSVRSKPDRRKAELSRGKGSRSRTSGENSEADEFAAAPSPSSEPTVQEGTVTVMFSDIVGYSAITERLGEIVKSCG